MDYPYYVVSRKNFVRRNCKEIIEFLIFPWRTRIHHRDKKLFKNSDSSIIELYNFSMTNTPFYHESFSNDGKKDMAKRCLNHCVIQIPARKLKYYYSYAFHKISILPSIIKLSNYINFNFSSN